MLAETKTYAVPKMIAQVNASETSEWSEKESETDTLDFDLASFTDIGVPS